MNKVLKVHVRNVELKTLGGVVRKIRGKATGHWIVARDREDAISIAIRHKIGNPMGGETEEHRIDEHPNYPFNYSRANAGGKVWAEVEGELVGYKTPMSADVINQLGLEGPDHG